MFRIISFKKNELPFVAMKNHSCVYVNNIHSNTSTPFLVYYA